MLQELSDLDIVATLACSKALIEQDLAQLREKLQAILHASHKPDLYSCAEQARLAFPQRDVDKMVTCLVQTWAVC